MKNQLAKGFTITEIMIAIVVGSIASLTLVQIGILIYTAVASTEYRANTLELNENLLRTISKQDTCSTMFTVPAVTIDKGAFQTSVAVNSSNGATSGGQAISLRIPPPFQTEVDLAENAVLESRNIVVKTFRLSDAKAVGKDPKTGEEFWTAILYVRYAPVSSDLGLPPSAPRKVGSVSLRINGTNVTGCSRSDIADDPVKKCGSKTPSLIYFGVTTTDYPDKANVQSFRPDADGCIDPHVFLGLTGPPGDVGNPGIDGPQGPAGPDGNPIPVPNPIPIPVPVFIPSGPAPAPPSTPKFSDARVKSQPNSFDYGLRELLQVRPVWFAYNGAAGTTAGEVHAGVVAQELEKIAPRMVVKERVRLYPTDLVPSDVRKVKYDEFDPMLINAIQQQQEQIDQLRRELQELKRSAAIEK